MGNTETTLQRTQHTERTALSQSRSEPSTSQRHRSESVKARPNSPDSESPLHPQVQRSYSVPVARMRQDSVGSSYSSSMEGAYSDPYDGLTPLTFGGNYRKDIPRKCRPENFDAAHGNKLKMPLDSKQGSGFDLDWQYDEKSRRRVMAKRSLNPDHPLYHKLASRIAESAEEPSQSAQRTQV